MPKVQQYIRRDVWTRVRICLEFQKALGKPVKIVDIVNEVLELGLAVYADKYGVSIPPFGEAGSRGNDEEEQEIAVTVNGRKRRGA